MNGFTPINEDAFMELIGKLPEQHRLAARSICLDMLFHARRNAGIVGGVQLERGQVLYALRGVAKRCYVSLQTTRTVISWLKKVDFLTHKSTRPASTVSIIEFDRYVSDRIKTNTETNKQLTHNQHSTKGKRVKDKKEKNIYTQKKFTEARQALQCWTDHAHLPKSVNEEKCLKVLDDLHRLDGVPWEGPTGIYALCEYAAREWVPEGYIGSPMALRGWTHSRDMKKYEKIQQQMTARHSQTSANGAPKRPEYRITYPDGRPVTDFTKRLRRIDKNGWDEDPDQDHDWTIPDDVIAQAKIKGVDTFLKHRQQEGADHAV